MAVAQMSDLQFICLTFLICLLGLVISQFGLQKNKHFIVFLNCIFFTCLNGIYLTIPIFQLLVVHFLTRKPIKSQTIYFGAVVVFVPLILIRILDDDWIGGTFFSGIKIIGLAFYTLQIYAYFFDVWSERIPSEKSFSSLFCYVIFFPNLISGPVERPGPFMRQMEIPTGLKSLKMWPSILLVILGLFKKFVFAGNLSEYVLPVIERPYNYGGPNMVLSILLAKFLLYYDISGYSDIAVGVAGLYGITLTENFRRPLWTCNMKDFWQRWHISVSTWIRDYIFYPLLTTPAIKFGLFGVLLITFVLFGLWHGFTWPFVIYGVIQAFLLRFNFIFGKMHSFLNLGDGWFSKTVKWILFYPVFIGLPCVLFFSASLEDFINFLILMPSDFVLPFEKYLNLSRVPLLVIVFLIAFFEFLFYRTTVLDVCQWFLKKKYVQQFAIGLFVVIAFVALAKIKQSTAFIYGGF